ncbi:MAG: 2-C-methyl-D-erythritol 4-phosphate cytidylyltransferase, partial [Gammaproteobacteria bacterium]|nr:2-C-methyl-D-erythritol 4-phosphate cytidylyltransferase [Gammaproteobacteria bacterium]
MRHSRRPRARPAQMMPAASSDSAAALWAVVPAAGGGRRTGAAAPKQYLEVAGKTLLQHVLGRRRAHLRIRGIVAVLASAGG